MGLFNKKKKESHVADILAQNGYEMNDGKLPEQQKRKDAVAASNRKRESEQKKAHIDETFSKLRHSLMMTDGHEDQAMRVQEMISKFHRMEEIGDKEALLSVDALILGTARSVADQCNRGNFLGVEDYLNVLEGYLNDRASDQLCYYYKDEKFLKFTAEKNRYAVLLKVREAELMQKHREMEQLKAYANDPTKKIPTEMVVRKASQIKQNVEEIKRGISDAENKLAMLTKSLEQIKANLDHNANKSNFDMTTDMEDIFETKRENEMDSSMTDKFNSKLDEINKKVSSNNLIVNDNSFSSSNQPVELSDDLFRL